MYRKVFIEMNLRNFALQEAMHNKIKKLNFKEYYAYFFALAELYLGLFSVNVYFLIMFRADIIRFDNLFLEQIQYVLIAGMLFFLLGSKYFIQEKKVYDPNILYLRAMKLIYDRSIGIVIRLSK